MTHVQPEPKTPAPLAPVKVKTKDSAQGSFRANLFADKISLSWWFPQILDDETKNWQIWVSKRSRAILIQILIVSFVLFINVGVTIFAISHYGSDKGVGLIYQGGCDTAKKLDQWLQMLINFSQPGCSPTRADVNRAHQDGKWLDIGVPSLRKLKHISKWKRLAWVMLAVSSIPIHLMFNSAVFQSLPSNDYTIAVVKDSFLNGSLWNPETALANRGPYFPGTGSHAWNSPLRVDPPSFNSTEIVQSMQVAAMSGKYERRDLASCFALYDDYW
ncbi:hypothetical protein B0H63DRAFT_552594 [Podospora didyma]|uniref:DUF6536 domain-containing protein n=1 Tax=Podospora didyma TaxID=330526 RepID=A0AAE0K6K2_9PEZI|nr:hypothetical protein B0H63DRAFT_552594 [Podospora didyma]